MLKSLFSFLKRIDSIYSAILYRKSISSEGLPPHGGSGLKWEKHTAGSCRWWSPSTRREWIEIALWRGVSPSGVPSFLKQLLFATAFHARKRWQNHIPSISSATLQTAFPYIPSICNRRISSAASSTSYTYSFGTPVSAVSSTRDWYFLW